jgi:hypothetical protein
MKHQLASNVMFHPVDVLPLQPRARIGEQLTKHRSGGGILPDEF